MTRTKSLPIKYPVRYDELGTYIYDADDKMIADVRGWGWIQQLPYATDIQNGIGQLIAEALNEKHRAAQLPNAIADNN